ncbi:unnamed protein product [Leptidea sinapis]|uniref:Major facilitator superfamily associated domain-containing protein n=1 Tax=Leptidea sinapis TaxID=189913 RepID=A0A5E4PW64_9NEOP|nr:unnamed protein product [Leptidea sinapis]
MSAARRYGAETAALFVVLLLLGTLWSGIDAYLPWTVRELNASSVQVGLTMTAGALPALPALWWAEAVVDYIGHSNVFITAFTFYCLRYLVISEVLEVFTLSLVWVTAVLYFRHLVPKKYTTTGQALPVIAHFCLGRCIGSIISGMVSLGSELESTREVYRALGVVALVVAAVYLALYHLLLAPRCASPATSPPPHLLQACSLDGQLAGKGLTTNGASNGTWNTPMRVYHEERSRKGHFRY